MKTLYIVFLFFLPLNLFAQWFSQDSGTNDDLNTVYFATANSGWVTKNCILLKTNDGGNNWFEQNDFTPEYIECIYFVNEYNGWIITYSFSGVESRIYKTTDGGDSWLQIYYLYWSHLYEVDFVNDSLGWCVGGGGLYPLPWVGIVLKTIDGGINWSPSNISAEYYDAFFSVQFINSLKGWIGGIAILFSTSDRGNNWNEITFPTSTSIEKVLFLTETVGWVRAHEYFEYGSLYKTTDAGLNWDLQVSQIKSFCFEDDNTGWYIMNNSIFHTVDGGESWESQISDSVDQFNDIIFVDEYNGWAVGKNGRILHTSNGGVTFLENKANEIQPDEFSLSQNFPNPFNPSTILQYTIGSLQFVTLKVYDVLGNEIATLVNEEKAAGEYEVKFDASGLSSGIYFYRITAGSYAETRKMVLLR